LKTHNFIYYALKLIKIKSQMMMKIPATNTLYNVDSTLEIPRDVADAFLILLSEGSRNARIVRKELKLKPSSSSSSKSKNKCNNNKKMNCSNSKTSQKTCESQLLMTDNNSSHLGISAITEGNVIETTFGVETKGGIQRSKHTSKPAYQAAVSAKAAMSELSSDTILRQLAVEAYSKCFEIVITYHVELTKIGLRNWCWKQQKVRDTAEKRLVEAFAPLHDALADDSSR